MALSRILLIVGVAVILVSIGMAVGLVPNFTEVVEAVVAKSVGWISGAFLVLYGIWKAIPEPIQRIIAKVMRRIPNLPIYYKRRTIKFEIEGEINAALKEFNKEGAGFVEHEVVVDWLTPKEETRRLFFEGGKAYLKLDFNEDKEKVLVEAVVMYCNGCLLLGVRQYIERPLMRAIDLTFIDELLDRRNAISGRAYFVQEVIPREIEVTPGIRKYIDKLGLISQHGLFIRVLMPELKEYPGRIQSRIARGNHLVQVEEFIDFLRITAEDRTSKVKRLWLHIGETIRVGFMLVGAKDKLQFEGSRPYVRRTAMNNADGARTVYLIGYNLGVNFVLGIAKEAKQRGIVSEYEMSEYLALIGHEVKRQLVARLSIPDGAGKRFLDLYPNMAEWPDLEEETQISIVRGKAQKWEYDIDAAWSNRVAKSGEHVDGPAAGKDAAEVFGVARLEDAPYETLKSIIEASDYLNERWILEENRVTKRGEETKASVTRGQPQKWEYDVDGAWSKRVTRSREFVYGPAAGKDAAEAFGVARLKEGPYRTLKSIIEASDYLNERWILEENRVTKRGGETGASVIRGEPQKWEYDVDAMWSKRVTRSGEFIHGPAAGKDAAEVFGVAKLKEGPCKTLKRVFEASDYLSGRWILEENKIVKK